MSEKPKISNCPFCKGKASFVTHQTRFDIFSVECEDDRCGFRGPYDKRQTDALVAWEKVCERLPKRKVDIWITKTTEADKFGAPITYYSVFGSEREAQRYALNWFLREVASYPAALEFRCISDDDIDYVKKTLESGGDEEYEIAIDLACDPEECEVSSDEIEV